jgi:hypothetical protein
MARLNREAVFQVGRSIHGPPSGPWAASTSTQRSSVSPTYPSTTSSNFLRHLLQIPYLLHPEDDSRTPQPLQDRRRLRGG